MKSEQPQRAATVENFLFILGGHLTQYDIRQSRGNYYNPYALAQYFGALERVEKETGEHALSDTPEAMKALAASLVRNFTTKRFSNPIKFELPPINAIAKKMDAWINDGKFPKYPGMKR